MKAALILGMAMLGVVMLTVLEPALAIQYSPIIMLILAVLFIAYFLILYSTRASGNKEIAVVAILGAFSAAARIPFAAIPSVQPCTFIILVTGYVFGESAGFVVGAETAFLSNFLLGQGAWTPWQMLAWGIAGILGALFRRAFEGNRYELYLFVALGIGTGYLFGMITNIWYWLAYTYPHTLYGFIIVELTSLPFDTLHAASNAIFIQLFGPKFITVLKKYKERYGIFSDFCAAKTAGPPQ